MNKKKKKHAKKIIYIFVETLLIVVLIGLIYLFWSVNAGKTKNTKEQEKSADRITLTEIKIENLEGKNVSKKAQNHNDATDISRYGNELSNREYCLENRIYAKDTISPDEVVLAFAGDISFAEGYANMGSLYKRENGIWDCFDKPLLDKMANADIFMVNNEFPYTDRGTPTEGKTYTFRAKPASVEYLYDMGVDIVSLANNHVSDYGEVSVLDTLATLQQVSMPYVGAGENIEEAVKPVYFIANDIKIAFVSATQIERLDSPDTKGATDNSPGTLRCWNDNRILEVIKKAKQKSDYVIAYIHWGTEMQVEPDWAQIKQAKEIADAGADLIVGDHPHILQQITYVEGVPLIYSLGNFWFNSKAQDTGLFVATLNAEGIKSIQFVPARQENCKTVLLDGSEKNRVLQYMQSISPDIILDEDGNIQKKP